MNGQVEEGTRADLKENHSFNTYYQFMLPLGADKMDHYSKAVFSVQSNKENKNYDTVQSAWELFTNCERPEVCSFIRLGATLLQSEDGKR